MRKHIAVLIILAGLLAGAVVHEFTHSFQSLALGNGWQWPMVGPWSCGYGPNGFPGLACTEVGDGFGSSWWSGEALAYAVQALATGIVIWLLLRRYH